MHQLVRQSVVFLMVAVLVAVPLAGSVMAGDSMGEETYFKDDISGEAMLFDLVIVRPVSILATIAGGVLWPFTFPFWFSERTAADTRTEAGVTFEKYIGEPIQYTFNRRLGDM
jgi:hypothetical protein